MKYRMALAALAAAVLTPCLTAQFVDFDIQGPSCSYAFPIGAGTPGDPEGVCWNGLGMNPVTSGPGATIDLDNGCGFPATGAQYLRVFANGPESIMGGCPSNITLTNATEVYIPIPLGAGSVSLWWDFYNCEFPASTTNNDGMLIDVLDASGQTLGVLAYADTYSPPGSLVDGIGSSGLTLAVCPSMCPGIDLLPSPGPEYVNAEPLGYGATWIRVAVWNGGDNSVSSHGVVDGVSFQAGKQLIIQGTPTLTGLWQIDILNVNFTPNLGYFTCLTPNGGSFPEGWFFGIDPLLSDVLYEMWMGAPPFMGVLDANGDSSWTYIAPMPLGVTLYGVTIEHVNWLPVGVSLPTSGNI